MIGVLGIAWVAALAAPSGVQSEISGGVVKLGPLTGL
jgi:hypothetical protein